MMNVEGSTLLSETHFDIHHSLFVSSAVPSLVLLFDIPIVSFLRRVSTALSLIYEPPP